MDVARHGSAGKDSPDIHNMRIFTDQKLHCLGIWGVRVRVVIEGVAPLLMHRYPIEEAEELRRRGRCLQPSLRLRGLCIGVGMAAIYYLWIYAMLDEGEVYL